MVATRIALTTLAAAAAVSSEAAVTETCLVASELNVKTGSVSSLQSVEGLATKDLSNSQDQWAKYVEAVVSNKNFEAELVFELPNSMSANKVTSVETVVNFRGELGSNERWVLEMNNKVIWDNSDTTAWKWSKTNVVTPMSGLSGDEIKVTLGPDSQVNQNGLFDLVKICFFEDDTVEEEEEEEEEENQTFDDSLGSCYNNQNSHFDEWSFRALICGLYIYDSDKEADWFKTVTTRKNQFCNTVLLDSSLSSYFVTDEVYDERMAMVKSVTDIAHDLDMKIIMYYPMFEWVTQDGLNDDNSASKLHPDWLQVSLSGTPNVFYGGEAWLEDTDESAWLDPSSEDFVDFVKRRVKLLVDTGIDGLWGDVPIYSDRVGEWMGASDNSKAAFKAWSKTEKLCKDGNNYGCDLPEPPQYWLGETEEFKYWLLWRHYSIAKFLEEIRVTVRNRNSDFVFFVENYPADYDGTLSGFDAAWYLPNAKKGMSNVWEIDSVSFETGMKFTSKEDFANQITMRKYARGIDRESPSWAFSYGNGKLDAGLVMAGTLAVGNNPLEAKTPLIASTVSASFRSTWYEWANKYACELFETPRLALVGVMHSSSTHDLHDIYNGCSYGIFTTTKKTVKKKMHWWASSDEETAAGCDHLGSYRGVSYALQQLMVPFKVVNEVGILPSDLSGLQMLWLPTVPMLGDEAIAQIKTFVNDGGVLVVTGLVPAVYDMYGDMRPEQGLKEIFGADLVEGQSRQAAYGRGVAMYRADHAPVQIFDSFTKKQRKAALAGTQDVVEQYVQEMVRIPNGKNILVEIGQKFDNTQYIYLVNQKGIKIPVKSKKQKVTVWFYAGEEEVTKAAAYGPTKPSSGPKYGTLLKVKSKGKGWYTVSNVFIDQFTMLALCVGGNC